MKKIICLLAAFVMGMSTVAHANDYTYEYSNFLANVVVPQIGVCDFAKSYAGHEDEITASEYFSGIVSAFRMDIDNDGNKELVFANDNLISVYRIIDGEPAFVDSEPVTLVCDYGESYANVFVKNHEGREYLCVENFVDSGAEKSYELKMYYVKNNALSLSERCLISKVIKDDYSSEKAVLTMEDRTTAYSSSNINGISTSVNADKYEDLYDAAWQMLNAMGFERASFLNSINRLLLDETDAGMYYQITNQIDDVDLKTYVRASGIRTSDKPVVYFSDNSELANLNVAPTPTPVPTMIPAMTPPPTAVPTEAPVVTEAPQKPTENTEKVTVVIDGEVLEIEDQPAQIINDRTLVPMRAIFEKLGAAVQWLHEYRMVVANTDTTNITMKIDDATYYVNGESKTLDVPAQIVNDRTMIPARAVAESLGCTVEWDQATKTVIIKTKNYVEPAPQPTEAPVVEPTVAPEVTTEPEETIEEIEDAENEELAGDTQEPVIDER